MLARGIAFSTASNGSNAGFNIATATNHGEVYGYVREHRLMDGTASEWIKNKEEYQ